MALYSLQAVLWRGMVSLLLAGHWCDIVSSAPALPTAVTVSSISTSQIIVDVTLPADDQGYDGVSVELLFRGEFFSKGSSPVQQITVSSSPREESFTVSLSPALVPGATFTVRVRSRSGTEHSGYFNVTRASTVIPPSPTAVTVSSFNTTQITVSVALPYGVYDGVSVDLGENSVSQGSSSEEQITVSSSTRDESFTVSLSPALVPGTTYAVRVRSRSGSQYSGYSTVTPTITVTPASPTAVTVSSITTSQIIVSVTIPVGLYDGVSVDLVFGGNSVSNGSSEQPSQRQEPFTVPLSPALVPGTTYTVRVRSRSGSEYSEYSTDTPTSTVSPSKPITVSIEEIARNGRIYVTWKRGTPFGVVNKFVFTRTTVTPNTVAQTTDYDITVQDQANQRENFDLEIPDDTVKGETYTVTVTAVANGVSSEGATFNPLVITPASPTAVTVSSISTSEITVSVTLPVGVYDGVSVDLVFGGNSVSQGSSSGPQITVSSSPRQESITVSLSTALAPGTTYTVRVRSRSGSEYSDYSTDTPSSTVNAPPVNVSLNSKTSRSLELAWGRHDPNVKNFRLLVKQEETETCLQEIHFTEKGTVPQGNKGSCKMSENNPFVSSALDFTYNITALQPYTSYIIDVYTKSKGATEILVPATLRQITDSEVPSKLTITSVSLGGPRNVTVCWSKSDPFPGPTNYTVTLVDQGEGKREQDLITMVTGYDIDCKYLDKLDEFWEYSIKVSASTSAGVGPQTESTIFRTQPSVPGNVTDFTIKPFPTSVNLVDVTWRPPNLRDRNANISGFNLKYQAYDKGVLGNQTTFTIPWSTDTIYSQRVAVEEKRQYVFTIWVSSGTSSGTKSSIYYTHRVNSAASSENPVNGGIIAMGVVIAILVVGFIVVGVLLLWRRRLQRSHREAAGMISNDDYTTIQNMKSMDTDANYESMAIGQMIIPETQIQISEKMLGGSTKNVSLGVLLHPDGNNTSIAIRKCKGRIVKEAVIAEAEILRAVSPHTNIVKFLGYSIKTDNVLMVTEFEVNGDLESYLRHHRGSSTPLTEDKLLMFAEQIASGMMHLSQQNIIHCDLRTHNVLISDLMVAKISGFQHAGTVDDGNKVLIKSSIPSFRWMPLETMERKEFSLYSDIWSFGVTFWEIMTYGATPYKGMKLTQVKQFIKQTYRLACPKSCQHQLYSVMLDCWIDEPEERQSLENIIDRLRSMSQDLQHYVNVGIYETLGFEDEYENVKSTV